MAVKTVYIPDEKYMRLGAVGKAMWARDPDNIKKGEFVKVAINACLDGYLSVLEEKYGLIAAGN